MLMATRPHRVEVDVSAVLVIFPYEGVSNIFLCFGFYLGFTQKYIPSSTGALLFSVKLNAWMDDKENVHKK